MMFKARYLLSAALAPAVLLFFYIRKKDKVEPEPMKLLLLMALGGALTTIPAAILELIGGAVLGIVFTEGSPVFNFIESFFIVALAEEGCKYIVLLLTSWWSKEFNYTYDAVVYAVSVSLGFAALENVLYVFQGGFSTAILRALTSVPGHMIFAVFMGYHYGIAKKGTHHYRLRNITGTPDAYPWLLRLLPVHAVMVLRTHIPGILRGSNSTRIPRREQALARRFADKCTV